MLIFDEVLVGFRLARGGAQEYFGVKADLVTYGKTLGGGFPVGALCGRGDLMRRYREDRPGDICFARGTFNSHPYVICAMRRFLQRLDEPFCRDLYRDLDRIWNERADSLNARLETENLPVRVANMSSIMMVCYSEPSRYNWMLQYYLRAEGLALPWTGTGRLIFSLNYTDADFAAVTERFLAAAKAMRDDGWWTAPSRPDEQGDPPRRSQRGAALSAFRSAGASARTRRLSPKAPPSPRSCSAGADSPDWRPCSCARGTGARYSPRNSPARSRDRRRARR